LTECPGICLQEGSGFSAPVFVIGQQSSEKLIVGAGGTYQGITFPQFVKRLEYNGDFDTTFNSGGIGANGSVISLDIQADNKILVGGSFAAYNTIVIPRLIRLNADGSIDTSFQSGTGPSPGQVSTIQTQFDTKIMVGGSFTNYSGITANRLMRLNSDGTFDSTFSIGAGFDNAVECVRVQSDGKYIAVGIYTNFSGQSRNRIARLNSNGSLDTTFVVGTGLSSIGRWVEIQSDGKYIVGGDFTSYSGLSADRIVRLNTDGSRDSSFVIGTGFNGTVRQVLILPSGKIMCVGDFTSYSGVSCNRIVRLNTDGSVDTTFNSGSGFNNSVRTIILDSKGYFTIGGDFTNYNGVISNRIVRLDQFGNLKDCEPILITPTITASPTRTPTVTITPTQTSTIPVTPSMTPTSTPDCPFTIYTHGAVRATCSDYCNDNYLIQTIDCASQPYSSLTIGDFIYGYAGQSGYIAYSNISTDTNTGPYRIADIDGSGEILGIYICSGGSCIPL
jgi:uncharacterized delta-60 repeat protein